MLTINAAIVLILSAGQQAVVHANQCGSKSLTTPLAIYALAASGSSSAEP